MFNRCVQTDSGKSIVRDHKENYDAQAVYRKLEHHAKMSTKAQLAKNTLMTDLTTSKLDSSWRGTNEGFILMGKEKMRLFEDMTPNNHRYAPEIKRSMLENSVALSQNSTASKISRINLLPSEILLWNTKPIVTCSSLQVTNWISSTKSLLIVASVMVTKPILVIFVLKKTIMDVAT